MEGRVGFAVAVKIFLGILIGNGLTSSSQWQDSLLSTAKGVQGRPGLLAAVVLPDDRWQLVVILVAQEFLAEQGVHGLAEVDRLPVVHINVGTVVEEEVLLDVTR